ncbi:serine hydrolase, partial [Patescibacteria group bacterium]|nr:serine hydrolase [Patescibacteria group bacterium]
TTFLNFYAAASLGTSNGYLDESPKEPTYSAPNPIVLEVKYAETLPASKIPTKKTDTVAPQIEAKAAIIIDFESGAILYEKNADQKMQIASITKLMTAIIALENADFGEVVNVSNKAALTEGSKAWLLQGEKITMKNLLYALLINSGNDAAIAIAEHIAGDIPSFVTMMNEKAKKLGLIGTHFQNPIGFDSLENYSTARDVALMGRYAFRNSFVRTTAQIQSMQIESTDGNISHELENTNTLLNSFLNIIGLKTGSTELAGLCFISVIDNGYGNKIITVVLNSPDRFQETKSLASWAFRSYIW